MLTEANQKNDNKIGQNPREQLRLLPGVTESFLIDFMTGLEFGAFENMTHIKWKHGGPWKYPAHEFPMLRTVIKAFLTADMLNSAKAKLPKIEMPEAEKQKSMAREKAFQEYINRKK